jgi:gas vesicle protein GvpL/GvpF
MAWYVFALLDAPPSRRAGRGLSGPIAIREAGACYVAVERRADVPPIELGALKQHHDVVGRLWERVPAVLPVRFGTLLASEEIAEALEDKDEEVVEAFDLVRGRAQFSWRARAVRPRATSTTTVSQLAASSGTEYLRRAARATAPPRRFSAICRAVGRFSAAQRYEPARPSVPETLYHLVDRERIRAYLAAASKIASSSRMPGVSGPFPAYAFVPELLG